MRLRRYIAILLMTLANVFILVHAVIPHSHHDGIVCLASKEKECVCPHDKESHDKPSLDTSEEHHGHLESCDLQDFVKRTEPSSEEELVPSNPIHVNHFITICLACLYDHLAFCAQLENKDRHYIFLSNNYISPYVGSIYGLRAPPTFSC